MKKIFTLAAFATLALTFTTSCGSDDDDMPSVNPTDLPASAGGLSSGTDADKSLPDGYRIASVGYSTYEYDESGKLIGINGRMISNGVLTSDDEDGKWTTKISVNSQGLITAIYDSEEWSEKYDGATYTEKAECTTTCSYNSNNQLNSAKIVYKIEAKEGGEKYTESGNVNSTFTYDGKKLLKITENGNALEDGEKYIEKAVYTFNYSNSSANTFYQYTPKMTDIIDDICWEVSSLYDFCNLGMVGRASSMLPSSIDEESESIEDGEKETYSHTITCGPYSFNSYGALSSADGINYTYTTIGSTRATTPVWQASSKRLTAKERIAKLRERMHRKK